MNTTALATTSLDVPAITYSTEQVQLIKDMYAKGATNDELKLLMYMSQKYGLDILTKQIWCVKYSGQPAQIYTSRDGFISIAHRIKTPDGRPALDGFNTKIDRIPERFSVRYYDTQKKRYETFDSDFQYIATCTVHRKDMEHPIEITVYEEEYSTGRNLWQSKRRTMIGKVAESQAFRKAFDISGLYGEDEMGQWEEGARAGAMARIKGEVENVDTETGEIVEAENIDFEEMEEEFSKDDQPKEPAKTSKQETYNPREFKIRGGKYEGKVLSECPSWWLQARFEDIESGKSDPAKYGYDKERYMAMFAQAIAIRAEAKEKE